MVDTAINNASGNLTYADLERAWKLLNEIKPVLYYALSEYITETDKIYKVLAYGEELYAMHPASFLAFEREALAAGYKLVDLKTTQLYGYPAGYSPALTHHPRPSPTSDLVDPLLPQLKAAQAVNASHLSADGKTAYCTRYGKVLKADWLGREFGSWQEDMGLAEVPAGAVVVE